MSQVLNFPAAAVRGNVSAGTRPGALTGLLRRLLAAWRLGRELRHLEELGPEALKDIGIGSGNLEGAIRHGRERPRAAPPAEPCKTKAPLMPVSWTEWR